MSVIDKQLDYADGDAYSSQDYEMFCDGETILRMGKSPVCGLCRTFIRFTGISGLAGATIVEAYIELYYSSREGTPWLYIYAEDAESPTQIIGISDHRNRIRTTAYTDWAWSVLGWQQLSILPAVQELANNYNPSAIQVFCDLPPGLPEGNSMDVRSYEYGIHTFAPKLHIEYTVGGWTGKISGITNPAKIMNIDSANISKVKGVG